MLARGFGHIAERAFGERLSRVPRILRGGDHDDRQLRAGAAEFGESAQTVHSRHGDVQDDDVEIGVRRDERKRSLGVPDLQNVRAGSQLPEQGGEAVAHDRMIVDHQHLHAHDYGALKGRRTTGRKSRQPQWS